MIYVIEPQCEGYEHVELNITFIRLIPLIFPNKSIKFFANSSHASVLNSRYGKEIVSHIAEIGDIDNAKFFMKKLSNMAEKNGVEKIIFLSISSFQAFYIEKFLGSGSYKVYMFLHHVVSELSRRPSLRPHLFIRWFYFILFFGSPSIKKIVFSRSIANNINKYLFHHQKVLFCNLPYDFRNFNSDKKKYNSNIGLRLTLPGQGRIKKGVLDFIELGKIFKNKKNISFSVAGSISLDKEIYIDSGVDCISSELLISEEKYKLRMENSDYLVLLHKPEMYKYLFSGVLLDAIKYQKPIIAIKNPLFEEFFTRYGDIGYLLDSVVEVRDLIGYLNLNPGDQYQKYLENINHISIRYEKDTIKSIRAVLQ